MQPTLALSATHSGIVYINGRFAGEVNADCPLMRPVSAQGALILEYRPLSNACRAMARRLVFAHGAPMAESASEAENLNLVVWPAGVVEVEFSPPQCETQARHFQLGGHSFRLEADARLFCDGRLLTSLPEGAEVPELRPAASGMMLTGRCDGGRYLLTTDENFSAQTGFLRAQELNFESDGRIRAIAAPPDLVGHATLEIWRLTAEGLMLISSEPAWAHGAPRWPKSPQDAARAAVEAALAGLDAEAERFLTPALRMRAPLSGIREVCDLCVEMKYAPPDGRSCVGLLRLEGENLARVRPMYYRAVPSGSPQGPYQLDEIIWDALN